MEPSEHTRDAGPGPDELWLGYARLVIPFELINAVLVYQPIWDRRIAQCYGTVPASTQAVVLLSDGRVFPSSRALADLHARWVAWQQAEQAADDHGQWDEPQ